jgi:DNA primase small subunit
LPWKDLEVKDLKRRELAFLQFGEHTMIRHIQLKDEDSLRQHLKHDPPAHLYYSSAYYTDPQASDMSKKGWSGADLIFDIDADHIPTPCKDEHDTWTCLDCNEKGRGFPPESCPNCHKKRIDTNNWICEKCLQVAKDEMFKLLDQYLIPDFGVNKNDIEICFSGHRGYHLHILNERLRWLSTDGRREVADYVRGVGLELDSHGFSVIKGKLVGPSIHDRGYRGRIANAFYKYLSGSSAKELKLAMGSDVETAEILYRNKERVLEGLKTTPPFWVELMGVGPERLLRIAKKAIEESFCNIDERVSIDIKRLIRYPNSLHGKTGLKASRISYTDLERFDPLKDAVAFKEGEIKVYVKDAPRVRIGDCEKGPLKKAEIEVPKALGLYLILKGAAEPRT